MESGEGEAAGGDEGGELWQAAELSPLTDETLTRFLLERYLADQIYTWAGWSLVCVRPARPLALYSARRALAYLPPKPRAPAPHPYAVMAEAYRWVRDRGENQCIVITGVSGSGKTETARVCVQWACVVGGGAGRGEGSGAASSPAALLPAAGAVLEAFGNAATLYNHNASRFGKLLEMEIDASGGITSAHITHYILEKSRASGAAGERNYHVLHQLLAADAATLQRLKLSGRGGRAWRLLAGGAARAGGAGGGGSAPCSPRRAPPAARLHAAAAAAADAQQFTHTQAALAALGVCGSEVAALLAALLKLGEATFAPAQRLQPALAVRLLAKQEWYEACSLVGVDPAALLRALGVSPPSPRASPPPPPAAGDACGEWGEGEGEEAGEDEAAAWARDALINDVYERLFTWLVEKINEALSSFPGGGSRGGGCGGGGGSLGVLDLYGWEGAGGGGAGVDTLAINYAAERLQAAVDQALRARLEACGGGVEGGAAWSVLLDAPTAAELVAHHLDTGPCCVISLWSRGAGGGCGARCGGGAGGGWRGALRRLQDARLATVAALPPHHFRVCHFAGDVVYCARAVWGARGAAARAGRARPVLAAATCPLLQALYPALAAADAHAHDRWSSPLARQRALVGALARRVAGSDVRVLRCVRPLPPAPTSLHAPAPAALRDQCAHQRIVEELAAYRAAGHAQMSAAAARSWLWPLRDVSRRAPPAPRAACRAVLAALLPPRHADLRGDTVRLHSHHAVCVVECARALRLRWAARRLQAWWRRRRAAACIARAWRRYRTARRARPRARPLAVGAPPLSPLDPRMLEAGQRICRWWVRTMARRYLAALARALPPEHASPLCAYWPPPPAPRLRPAHLQLQRLHHRARCYAYRLRFDQRARNRMREKVTAALLFAGRKATYPETVARPFRGDYLRLRRAAAYAPPAHDAYLVFADLVAQVCAGAGGGGAGGGVRVRRAACCVSVWGVSLLGARSLRPRRRLRATRLRALALSPHADSHLALLLHHEEESSSEEEAQCSPHAACLFAGGAGSEGGGGARGGGGGGRGDVLLECAHALELATKLYLVAQNKRNPLHLHIATEFDMVLGEEVVRVTFHPGGGAGGQGAGRYVRRGERLIVLV